MATRSRIAREAEQSVPAARNRRSSQLTGLTLSTAARDDAIAAQYEHDLQRRQYEETSRRAKRHRDDELRVMSLTQPIAMPAGCDQSRLAAEPRRSKSLRTADHEAQDDIVTDTQVALPRAALQLTQSLPVSSVINNTVRVSKKCRTEQLDSFIQDHRNANTQSSYLSAFNQFRRWATDIENPSRAAEDAVNVDHPDGTDISQYLRYIAMDKHVSAQTLTAALAAIADHIRYDITSAYNPCSDRRVQHMKATLVPFAKAARQKKEISWDQLTAIHTATVIAGDMLSQRDSCMFMLAYFGFLRISEIVRMDRNHISVEGNQHGRNSIMRVYVDPRCKNDKERKGHERLIHQRGSNDGQHCMIRQMRSYLASMELQRAPSALSAMSTSQPLFTTDDGARMQNDTPRGRLKHWMRVIGVTDAERYGFHSLRAGGATDAARAGTDIRHIKQHGNWKSNAVELYIRPNINDRLRVSNALGTNNAI
jgi:integrase